ncbi:MAG: type II toxin-antitoxin system VapC family toxin [Thermodesulfobacteriota bacterium]|nr:type II toxin-antitoxin system VapC family toxin [Thermodesulfobacteriota bacterium]
MILLDTHALVWLDEGNKRIGRRTLDIVNEELSCGTLAVSAITFWETAMLVEKGRLDINIELSAWRKTLFESGLKEIPLNGAMGIRAGSMNNFQGDPADRMIVATALEISATLVTADKKILAWQGLTSKQDARL